MNVDKEQIKQMARYVMHDGGRHVALALPPKDRGGGATAAAIDGEEALIKFCEEHNGDGYMAISFNPMTKPKAAGTKDEVAAIANFAIDIDVDKEHRTKGLAPMEYQQRAIDAAEDVWGYLIDEYNLHPSILVSTGNGAQIVIPLALPLPHEEEARRRRIEQIESRVSALYDEAGQSVEGDGVDVDHKIKGIQSKIKIAGTQNIKHSKIPEKRMAEIIKINKIAPVDALAEANADVFLALDLGAEQPQSAPPPSQGTRDAPEDVREALRPCMVASFEAGERWDGEQGHTFRHAVAVDLIQAGCSDATICQFFKEHDQRSGEHYDQGKTLQQLSHARQYGYNRYSCKKLRADAGSLVSAHCTSCNFMNRLRQEGEVIPIQICAMQARHIDRNITVDAQITGEKTKKAIAAKIVVECQNCDASCDVPLTDLKYSDVAAAVLFKDNKRLKNTLAYILKTECGSCDDSSEGGDDNKKHVVSYREVGWSDYSILYVRDIIQNIEAQKFDGEVYKSRPCFVIGAELPSNKKVTIQGKVIVNTKNRDIAILANAIEPYEDVMENYQITNEDMKTFQRIFPNITLDEMAPQVAPDMVGRPLVQKSRLLNLHSVHTIPDINGKLIRGCIRECLYGDSKTYKSMSGEDIINTYSLGEYIQAESSSRAGIAYTIDTDRRALIWGALPLNDRGYVVLTGLHAMFSEEMKELREILETQKIVVKKYVSDEALARVRITADLNPNKPLNQYINPCRAILDSRAFQDPPDVTRFDVYIPCADGDVAKADIASRTTAERPIPVDVFMRHAYWAWSRNPSDIEYTKKAKAAIIEHSRDMMDRYSVASLPIIHNGSRDVITRLSVAAAALHHSTGEKHQKVIVDEEHVEEAVNFYEAVMDKLELLKYKEEEQGRLMITDAEFGAIVKDLERREYDILDHIKTEAKSSSELATMLDCVEKTIKRSYAILKKHKLIKTIRGKGVTITPRGIQFLKKIESSDISGDKGTKPVPPTEENSTLYDKNKGTENVTMSPGGQYPTPKKIDKKVLTDNTVFGDMVVDIMRQHPAYEWAAQDIARELEYDTDTVATRMKDLAEDPDTPIGRRPNGTYVLTEGKHHG